MATRRKMTLADLDRRAESRRAAYMQSRQDIRNREAKAGALVRQLAEQDPSLTDEQLVEIFSKTVSGEDFDTAEFTAKQPTLPDFSRVTGGADSVPAEPERETGLRRALSAGEMAWDTQVATRSSAAAASAFTELDQLKNASLHSFMTTQEQRLGIVPSEEVLRRRRDVRERQLRERLAEESASAQEAQTSLESLAGRVGENTALGRTARAVGGFAGQAENQALPLVTGAVGAAAGGAPGAFALGAAGTLPLARQAYNSAYMEARTEFGATEAEANDYAQIMTAIEFAPSAISGGAGGILTTAGARLGLTSLTKEGAKAALTRKVRSRAARIGGAALLEGADEVAAGELGRQARSLMEGSDFFASEESQQALSKRVAQDTANRFSDMLDDFMAGIVGRTTIATPTAHLAYVAEMGTQEAETRRRMLEESRRVTDRRRPLDATPVQPDMFGTPEGLPPAEQYEADRQRQLEEDAAWQQRERQRSREPDQETREGLRQSLMPAVDRAQARVDALEDAIENGDTSSGTRNALVEARQELAAAQAVVDRFDASMATPSRTEEGRTAVPERAPVQRDFVAEQEAAQTAQDVSDIAKRREAIAKQQETARKKAQQQEQRQERATRRQAMDRLIEQYPNETPEQLAQRLRRGEGMQAPTPEPAPTPAPKKRAAKKAAKKTAPKPDKQLTQQDAEAEIRRMAEEQGILSELPEGEAGSPATDANFVRKASQILHNVARKNTNETAAFQNLLRQGKLVIVPNAASIGRTNTSALATFSPVEGKMYIYADNVNPNDSVSTLVRAVHEGSHGLQYNSREGRSRTLDSIFGDVAGTAGRVRTQARQGNKLAAEAVRRAEQDTENRRQNGEQNPDRYENYEILAYLMGEATEARNKGGTLGSLRGVVNDAVANSKKLLRDNLGVDLDVSVADIAAAANSVLSEVVETDIAPRAGGELNIVAGARGAGADFAEAEGRSWVGKVDGLFRYEIPDAGAELDSGLIGRLNTAFKESSGGRVRLGNLLKHAELYSNYPDLRNVNVFVGDLGSAWGQYDPRTKGITISPRVLNYAATIPDAQSIWSDSPDITNLEFLRNLILHETQHAVQDIEGFVPGTSSTNFIPQPTRAALENTRAALDRVINNFELGRAVETLSPPALRAWRNELEASGVISRDAQAELFLAEGYHEDSRDRMIRRYGQQYAPAFEAWSDAKAAYDSAEARAYDIYRRDAGELEARTVEWRSRKTPEELAAIPFEDDTVNAREGLPIEEALDTTLRSGGRNLAESSPEGLDMSETVPGTNVPRTVPRERLSLKERVKRVVMTGTRAQTSDIKRAEELDNQYRKAIKKDMGTTMPTQEQQDEITALLTSIDNADLAKRQALWDSFKGKYPNLAEVLDVVRTRIDDNSARLVRERLATNVPLTNEEIKQFGAVLKNRGRYLTRAYAAFQGRAGREFRQTRWDNYANNIKDYLNETDTRRLRNTQVRRDVEAVLGAINYVKGKYFIPDNDALAAMPIAKLEKLYRDYGGVVDSIKVPKGDTQAKRDALVNALAQRRDAIQGPEADRMAERVVRGLLGLTDDVPHFAKGLTALARDPGTLKKKDFVPDEIRNLLGEMTNPGARILSTLSSQAALLSRQGVYLDFLNDHMGDLVLPATEIDLPGNREKLSTGSRGPVRLDSAEYGPLQGHYVHPYVADALVAANETFTTFAEAMDQFVEKPDALTSMAAGRLGRTAGAMTRWEKILGVIYNPARGIANYAGSGLQVVGSGNINFLRKGFWDNIRKGHVTGFDYVVSSATGGMTELLDDAYRYVNLEAADIGEIQHILGNTMKDYIEGTVGDAEVRSKIGEYFSKGAGAAIGAHRVVSSSYAVMDNWTKVANYYDRLDTLRQYYAIVDPKRPLSRIKEEAGNVTNYTNISYERVPKALKNIEGVGLTKFVPYFYEAYRTRWTNYNQAYLDIRRAAETQDPKAAGILYRAGLRRLLGNTLATVATPAMGVLKFPGLHTTVGFGMLAAFASDEDHEKLRRMVSEFAQEQDLLNFGVNEKGEPVFLNLSDLIDPYGPATDVIRLALNTPADELPSALGGMLTDLMISPAWLKNSLRLLAGYHLPESTIAEVMPEFTAAVQADAANLGINEATTNNVFKFMEGWVPGLIKARASFAQPRIANPQPIEFFGQKIPGLEDTSQLAKAMNRAGFRFETLNPQRRLNTYGMESSEEKSANRRDLNTSLMRAVDLTDKRMMELMLEYGEKELDRLSEDYKNVQSLREWGYDDESIQYFLTNAKSGGRRVWSEDEVAMLMSGQGQAVVSIKSIKDAVASRMNGMNEVQLESFQPRAEKAIEMVESAKDRLEAMGFIVKEK